jgi:superfamily II DNA or RNA helicase
MKLFDYQVDVINGVYRKIKEGKRKVAVVAPTGSGKTVMMGQICKDATDRGHRVLILVHLDVLVPQTRDKMISFGLKDRLGYIKAGYPENPTALIQIASIQTLARRKWWKGLTFNLVIYDECHLTMFSKVGQDIRYNICPDSLVLGFTATPWRLKKKEKLSTHFEDLVAAPNVLELQKLGKLSEMQYFTIGRPDLTGVRVVDGDYNEGDLARICEEPSYIAKVVEEYKTRCLGKTAIAFCVRVKHAEKLKEAFISSGISADIVTGETPYQKRKELYDAISTKKLMVLTSVNVVSIGFDVPSVEVGLLLRPSKSKALHYQQIGRVMRVHPDKPKGIILDQSGNLFEIGFPEDTLTYSLEKPSKDKTSPSGESSNKKDCPKCHTVLYNFVNVCPNCDHKFDGYYKGAGDTSSKGSELKPDSKDDPKAFYRKKLKEAYRKKYSPGWAFVRYQEFVGKDEFPSNSWALGAVFNGDESKIGEYYSHLCCVKERSNKPDTWVLNQLGKEFGMSQAVIYVQRTTGGIYATQR